MRTKSMSAIGVMVMTVVIGVGNASSSFAADTNRGDGSERMGVGGAVYSSSQLDGASDCRVAGRKVDMEQRIGAGGSTYFSSQPASGQMSTCHEVGRDMGGTQRIGHGGSIYFSSQPTIQTAGR